MRGDYQSDISRIEAWSPVVSKNMPENLAESLDQVESVFLQKLYWY